MSSADSSPGRERAYCGGKLRPPRTGTCRLPAGHGTEHVGIGRCRRHGGSTPSHQASARAELVRRSEAEALKLLAGMDLPPMGDPLTALGKLAAESVEWLRIIRGEVARLESVAGPDHQGDERIRVKVILLERGMDRAQKFAAELAKINLDERIAEMHARAAVLQGELMLGLVRAIVVRLGRSLDEPEVGSMVAEEFRALEARGGS